MEKIEEFQNVELKSKMQIMTTYTNPINTYKFAKILESILPTSLEQEFINLLEEVKKYIFKLENENQIKKILFEMHNSNTKNLLKNINSISKLSNIEYLNLDSNTKELCKEFILEYSKLMTNLFSTISNVAYKLIENNGTYIGIMDELELIKLDIEVINESLSKLVPMSLKYRKGLFIDNSKSIRQAIYLTKLSNKLIDDEINISELLSNKKEFDGVNNSIYLGFIKYYYKKRKTNPKQYKKN